MKGREKKQAERKSLNLRMFLASLQATAGVGMAVKKPKQATNCILPSCNSNTIHNGGYCCADHCKKHRVILRERRMSEVTG